MSDVRVCVHARCMLWDTRSCVVCCVCLLCMLSEVWASMTSWYWRYVAGIQLDGQSLHAEQGGVLRIEPHIPTHAAFQDTTYMIAEYDSLRGMVHVEWTRAHTNATALGATADAPFDVLRMRIGVPVNVVAHVLVPARIAHGPIAATMLPVRMYEGGVLLFDRGAVAGSSSSVGGVHAVHCADAACAGLHVHVSAGMFEVHVEYAPVDTHARDTIAAAAAAAPSRAHAPRRAHTPVRILHDDA